MSFKISSFAMSTLFQARAKLSWSAGDEFWAVNKQNRLVIVHAGLVLKIRVFSFIKKDNKNVRGISKGMLLNVE